MKHVTGQLELEEMVGVKRGGERERADGEGSRNTKFCTLCTKMYTVYKNVHCVPKKYTVYKNVHA